MVTGGIAIAVVPLAAATAGMAAASAATAAGGAAVAGAGAATAAAAAGISAGAAIAVGGGVLGTVGSAAAFIASANVTVTLAAPGSDAITVGTCDSAAARIQQLPGAPTLERVKEGVHYEDFMVNYPETTVGQARGERESAAKAPVEWKPVYVGGFKHFKYHGRGAMYLPDTDIKVLGSKLDLPANFPVFEGDFKVRNGAK